MHAMSVDDAYHVERVLARGVGGTTELVTIDGSGPFVRKKIPVGQAKRSVWAACADSDCPRLPRVESTYELPDEYVVVYDFVPGDSVEKIVAAQGPFPVQQAVSLAKDVCEAAGALHACGLVHRDITPANVIVAGDGAHLVDLGIARRIADGASRDTDALGTWGYAAPEQYGFAQTDIRSDIYSIGRLLAYMLTGTAPADEGFDDALADGQVVPPGLRGVIERATSFEPSARFQSAADLATALTGWDARESLPSVAEAAPAQQRHGEGEGTPRGDADRGRSRRPLAIALVVVLAAIVAVAALVALRGGDDSSAPEADPGPAASSSGTDAASDPSAGTGAGGAGDDGVAGDAGAGGVVDSGDAVQVTGLEWNVASDGTVIYLVALSNASGEQAVELPQVTLSGYDENGGVTFSTDVVFPIVQPGETLHMADIATDAGTTVDVKAEVSDSGYGSGSQGQSGAIAFDVADVAWSHDELGWSRFTGTVVALADAGDGGSEVRVDVVMRDGEGKLVGYATAYVSRPAVGSSAPFQADSVVDSNDAASYEAYACPWP